MNLHLDYLAGVWTGATVVSIACASLAIWLRREPRKAEVPVDE